MNGGELRMERGEPGLERMDRPDCWVLMGGCLPGWVRLVLSGRGGSGVSGVVNGERGLGTERRGSVQYGWKLGSFGAGTSRGVRGGGPGVGWQAQVVGGPGVGVSSRWGREGCSDHRSPR
jgi:hypothetical protein